MENRTDLIMALAGSMGMSCKAKKEDSHFDATTGTLYCGSKVYSAADIQQAKEFCADNAERMAQRKDSSADYYEIAAEAIALLEKNSIANGGRVVIREDDVQGS